MSLPLDDEVELHNFCSSFIHVLMRSSDVVGRGTVWSDSAMATGCSAAWRDGILTGQFLLTFASSHPTCMDGPVATCTGWRQQSHVHVICLFNWPQE